MVGTHAVLSLVACAHNNTTRKACLDKRTLGHRAHKHLTSDVLQKPITNGLPNVECVSGGDLDRLPSVRLLGDGRGRGVVVAAEGEE